MLQPSFAISLEQMKASLSREFGLWSQGLSDRPSLGSKKRGLSDFGSYNKSSFLFVCLLGVPKFEPLRSLEA